MIINALYIICCCVTVSLSIVNITSNYQVMDLLLNELCLNLDEDMRDFDEYELGLSDYLLTNGHYD